MLYVSMPVETPSMYSPIKSGARLQEYSTTSITHPERGWFQLDHANVFSMVVDVPEHKAQSNF